MEGLKPYHSDLDYIVIRSELRQLIAEKTFVVGTGETCHAMGQGGFFIG
jgi:hypothetical protein